MGRRKDAIRSKFKSFCKHSTLHGFYYFSNSTRWSIHLLWASIIIFSLTLCSFLSQMIWSKFVIDPTFTVVESSRYSIADVPFPAVTVCDSEVVYGPNSENITAILLRRGYSKKQVQSFYTSLVDVREVGFSPDPYLLKMHALLTDLDYPYHVLMDILKKPCDVLLVQCAWRSKIFKCSEMFRKVNTHRGYCCQFDINYFRKYAHGVTFTSGVENTEGLMVDFNAHYISPDGDITEGNAALFLFEHRDRITILDNSISLTSLTYYDINIDAWAIDSSENVKALSLTSRKCLLSSDKGSDFYQGCLSAAIFQKVVDNCRCLPFDYTANELLVVNYTQCSWDRLFCVYRTLEKVMSDMKDVIVKSSCYQRCDYVQYDTKVKYIRLSNNRKANNTSRFIVHFADNTCIKYRREVLYSWDQMLANLGGIFGLCVGGSLISIIELLWFLIDVFFTIIFPPTKVTPSKKALQKLGSRSSLLKNGNGFGKPKLAFLN